MIDEAQPKDWTAEGEAIEAELHRIRHQLLALLTERVNPWAAAHAAECKTTDDKDAVHDRYRYYDVTGALEGIEELVAEDENAEGFRRTEFDRGY
jgi:chorismate mutase